MDFKPFYSRYKDIAIKETRCITVTAKNSDVPPGEYGFIENYCTDKICDCRKVIITVVEARMPGQILATIGYRWESIEFYTNWMHGDKEIAKMITGTYLEIGNVQSSYAQNLFKLFKTMALTDEYVNRIKKHYTMFKEYRSKKKQ